MQTALSGLRPQPFVRACNVGAAGAFRYVDLSGETVSHASRRNSTVADPISPAELDARIATIRENIRELVEQAAASSGASDESLTADRIADYEAQLAEAIKLRESMS